jgi:hypothetical protein
MKTILTILTLAPLLVPNFASAALTTNLVSYWKLDDSSGNAADATASGNTLTNAHDRNTLRLRLDPQGDPSRFEPGMTVWLSR